MSRKDVEIIEAETRRLEALGIVLGMLRLNEPKRAGRRRMYETEADRQRAYPKRKSEQVTDCRKRSPSSVARPRIR
jgi:hypothetical protein